MDTMNRGSVMIALRSVVSLIAVVLALIAVGCSESDEEADDGFPPTADRGTISGSGAPFHLMDDLGNRADFSVRDCKPTKRTTEIPVGACQAMVIINGRKGSFAYRPEMFVALTTDGGAHRGHSSPDDGLGTGVTEADHTLSEFSKIHVRGNVLFDVGGAKVEYIDLRAYDDSTVLVTWRMRQ
ncbi:hypothetical protein ACGFIX_14140 [Nocardia salmonicida]|uniref:hypothetical protein n=1 Tax=Nocardia salmonicida TaxID=53431 RepID=UPI0037127997